MDQPDPSFMIYFWGVLGSLSVELFTALKSTIEADGKCPPLYTRPAYLIFRALFTLVVAGSLPFALDAQNILTAFYLGASAPLIIDKAARGLREKPPGDES